MPGINGKILGDWIQIVASLGVIAGFVVLVAIAFFSQLTRSEPAGQAIVAVREAPITQQDERARMLTQARRAELGTFIESNCPACHGPRLAGSIGPSLSNADLEHVSVGALAATILHGRPEKGMPPWEAQLSKEDADWIAERLKQGSSLE